MVTESTTFRASVPNVLSAFKIAGDGGARIQLDVPDTDLADALNILLWRDVVLEITVRPAQDERRDK